MNRTILTLKTTETSEAVVNGWNLSFTIESTPNRELKTIAVSGSNGGNYFSANRQEGGQISNSFSTGVDVSILTEVVAEFDAIVLSFATAQSEE